MQFEPPYQEYECFYCDDPVAEYEVVWRKVDNENQPFHKECAENMESNTEGGDI